MELINKLRRKTVIPPLPYPPDSNVLMLLNLLTEKEQIMQEAANEIEKLKRDLDNKSNPIKSFYSGSFRSL